MASQPQWSVTPLALSDSGSVNTTEYSDVITGFDGRFLDNVELFIGITLGGSPGTPTLTLTFQTSMDYGVASTATWRDAVAFTQLTATGTESKELSRTHGTAGQRLIGRAGRWKIVHTLASGSATWTGNLYASGR